MAILDIEVLRTKSADLIVQTLPDGSTAIFEVSTKNVYSLNPSAAAAWEACASATSLSQIALAMSRKLGVRVSDDLAHEAVSELAAVGLVTVTPGESLGTSRRDMLKVAGVGLPVALVLTGIEQRAHAQSAVSPPPVTTTGPDGGTTTAAPPGSTTAPPTSTTTTPPPGQVCDNFRIAFVKGVDQGGVTTPLAGAKFTLFDPNNNVITTLTTDANGFAEFTIASAAFGTYRLVEDHLNAPGGPYLPFERHIVVSRLCTDWLHDLHNFKAPSPS